MVKPRKDLTGMVFGRLTVIGQTEDYISPAGTHSAKWLVQCSCGSEPISVHYANLKSGDTTSCGCLQKERTIKANIKHGVYDTREYNSWNNMIQRCNNPQNPCYNYYGGRGITVCQRWLESSENFIKDMGECPEGMFLDRIDTNGVYCPENCRWTTTAEQVYNQRRRSHNTSGRTGVNWDAHSGKWSAKISKNGKRVNLGLFASFEDAVAAREAAELEVYGYNIE